MFAALAKFVTRYWPVVLAGWMVALVGLLLKAPPSSSVRSQDDSGALPDTVPSRLAIGMIQSDFDKPPAISSASIVMERPAGLTGSGPPTATQPAGPGSDWDYIARLTARLRERADQSHWTVLSPGDPRQAYLQGIMVSEEKGAAGGPKPQAAVIKIDLPYGFASPQAAEAVEWITTEMNSPPQPGLNVAVTGTASYGRDANAAAESSLHRTTLVCIIAVVLILLVTYRALAAAAISVATVSVAVVVATSIVSIGGAHGWSVSVLVEIFTVVVGYGAGVDFSLFFLSRYHEELGASAGVAVPASIPASGLPFGDSQRQRSREAVVRALVGTGPAILASAATVAAGLSLMYFAEFRVFHTAGPAVSISIILACLASLTLAPALAYLIGPRTFWPRRAFGLKAESARGIGLQSEIRNPKSEIEIRPRRFWDRLAAAVVRRRVLILLLTLATLVPLAAFGWRQGKVYDTLADLPQDAQSVRGAAIFKRHFQIGEMAPVQVLVELEHPLSPADWAAVALNVDRKLQQPGQPGSSSQTVQQVRSLAHPLGFIGMDKPLEISPEQASVLVSGTFSSRPPTTAPEGGPPPLLSRIGALLGIGQKEQAEMLRQFQEKRTQFLTEDLPRHVGGKRIDGSRELTAGLWEVTLPWPPYSNRAMDSLDSLAATVGQAVRETPQARGAEVRVHLAGDTPLMRDLREVTNRDFRFVGALAVAAIVLIVTVVIGDWLVALFVMLATILSYGAALGLTAWGFGLLFGSVGLDWKVDFSLFVILIAVGQDYNLFMLTRIVEEARRAETGPGQWSPGGAVQSAIARTGSIISYCGLIMAATLGSLASSPMRLLQELGVAFMIGLLLDTFLVRPLMVPAFILVFRRMKAGRGSNQPPMIAQ